MHYDRALQIVKISPNLYHAGLSCYIEVRSTPTDEEREALDFLERMGYYDVYWKV